MSNKGKRGRCRDAADVETPVSPDKRKKSDSQSVVNQQNASILNQNSGFLSNVKAFILSAGIGKVRIDLFRKQMLSNGATFIDKYEEQSLTHVIVDEKMEIDRMCRILKIDQPPNPDKVTVVKSLWLSSCLKNKSQVVEGPFQLDTKTYIHKKSLPETKSLGEQSSSVPSTSRQGPEVTNAALKSEGGTDEVKSEKDNGENKYRKVGVMWGHTQKPNNLEQDDPDSDYQPSGEEDNMQMEEVAAVNARGKEIPVSKQQNADLLPVVLVPCMSLTESVVICNSHS